MRLRGIEIVPFSSSARPRTYLACLPSGRVLEISGTVKEMLLLMDGSRSADEIAARLSSSSARPVRTPDVVRALETLFYPQGLAGRGDAEEPHSRPARSARAQARGVQLCPARVLEPLTRRLRVLFCRSALLASTALILLSLAAVAAALVRAAESGYPLRLSPVDSAALYGLLLVSVFIHELGHLSACSFHGCRHGELRFGLYLLFPVFYANVTQAWTLSRGARVAVDLGGVYFQMLLAVPAAAAYWLTGSMFWVLFCLALVSAALLALNPFLKFDGYWLCSDLLGVPNLRARSREALRQLLPGRAGCADSFSLRMQLPGWTRGGLVLYGLLSHLFFVIGFACLVRLLSSRLCPMLGSVARAPGEMGAAVERGEWADSAAIGLRALVTSAVLLGLCRMGWLGLVLAGRLLRRRGFRYQGSGFSAQPRSTQDKGDEGSPGVG
ncbi:MAG: hypothetical protein AB1640_04170 [bacterium]